MVNLQLVSLIILIIGLILLSVSLVFFTLHLLKKRQIENVKAVEVRNKEERHKQRKELKALTKSSKKLLMIGLLCLVLSVSAGGGVAYLSHYESSIAAAK
ncbi:DUF3899 domain-containing protein [Vagococcus hydrophili]|uniref:DUF3899 domain-containing protein n=1 Tax=Vagococcus hydrophili TaxID=2714947 RepID=A0A6G8ATW4_9ENTE|nr:DUF3899 domain-containing protein [Vagococcus hydrophili]QIL48420.1 DUF3899 domain-containing protein [Vagococcus hydrophili]